MNSTHLDKQLQQIRLDITSHSSQNSTSIDQIALKNHTTLWPPNTTHEYADPDQEPEHQNGPLGQTWIAEQDLPIFFLSSRFREDSCIGSSQGLNEGATFKMMPSRRSTTPAATRSSKHAGQDTRSGRIHRIRGRSPMGGHV